MDPCIIVAWRCEPPPCRAPQCAQRALNERPVVGRTLQRPSFRTDLAALQSVRLLASLPGPLPSLSFLVPLRPSMGSTVVLVLHQRVSADREQFSSLHRAGVDENDIACRVLSRTHSSQLPPGSPRTLPHLHHLFLFHSVQSCGRYLRLCPSTPRSRRQRPSSAPRAVLGLTLSAQLGPTRVFCNAHPSRPHLARTLPETGHLAFTCFASASSSASSPEAIITKIVFPSRPSSRASSRPSTSLRHGGGDGKTKSLNRSCFVCTPSNSSRRLFQFAW